MIFNIQLEAKAKGMKEADEKAEAEATALVVFMILMQGHYTYYLVNEVHTTTYLLTFSSENFSGKRKIENM